MSVARAYDAAAERPLAVLAQAVRPAFVGLRYASVLSLLAPSTG